jgi:dTDP-4-amino-4,6-dideoxygalactose transaminase
MLLSRDRRLLARARDLRDYDERRRHAPRFNYKLTDFQAALGRSQLRRLPAMLSRRSAIAARYRRGWSALPVRLPAPDGVRTHAFHRFVLSCPRTATGIARRLAMHGVVARPPVFQPIHRTLGLTGFPGAEHAYRHALSIPIYPTLTRKETEAVIGALQVVFP